MRIALIGGMPFPAVNIVSSILEKNPSIQVLILNNNTDDFPAEIKDNPQITLWQGTAKDKILIKNLLSNAQTLINMPGIDGSYAAEEEIISDWVSSISNILNLARNSNLERIIHISSSNIYGAVADSPVTEEHPIKPTDLKGIVDSLAEEMAHYYSSKYSLPIVMLRLFNLYGPYQSTENTVSSLISSALNNAPMQLWEEGEQAENLLYVEDFMDALHKILKTKFDSLAGESINIGNIGVIPVREIANMILSLLNKPQSLISFEKNHKQGSINLVPSIMKAKILLSWSPKTAIEEGLEKTINWHVENRNWWNVKPQRTADS